MGKNYPGNGKGRFVIKNAKRELKWEIWKVGSNLETWSKLRNCQNGGFQNGVLLVSKNGFITRIPTSFLSGFHGSKELFW